jgi:hypothetical protein
MLTADRGCPTDSMRDDARARGARPENPAKQKRRPRHLVGRPVSASRIKWLRNSRCVTVEYDQVHVDELF